MDKSLYSSKCIVLFPATDQVAASRIAVRIVMCLNSILTYYVLYSHFHREEYS